MLGLKIGTVRPPCTYWFLLENCPCFTRVSTLNLVVLGQVSDCVGVCWWSKIWERWASPRGMSIERRGSRVPQWLAYRI